MGLKDVPREFTDAAITPDRFSDIQAARRALLRENDPQPKTWVGKALRGGEWLLGGISDLANRNITLPIAQALTADDPLAQYRLERLRKQSTPVYGGEVLREAGVLRPDPEAHWAVKTGAAVGRFAVDVLADPLTYVPFGALTKAGRANKLLVSATKEGRAIEEGSKAWKLISEVHGEDFLRTTNEEIARVRASADDLFRQLTEEPAGAFERRKDEVVTRFAESKDRLPYFNHGTSKVFVGSKQHVGLTAKLGYDPLVGNPVKDVKPKTMRYMFPGLPNIPGGRFEIPFHLPPEAQEHLRKALEDVRLNQAADPLDARKAMEEIATKLESLKAEKKVWEPEINKQVAKKRSELRAYITATRRRLMQEEGLTAAQANDRLLTNDTYLRMQKEWDDATSLLRKKTLEHGKLEVVLRTQAAEHLSSTTDPSKFAPKKTEFKSAEEAGEWYTQYLNRRKAAEFLTKYGAVHKIPRETRASFNKEFMELIENFNAEELTKLNKSEMSARTYEDLKRLYLEKFPLTGNAVKVRIQDMWIKLQELASQDETLKGIIPHLSPEDKEGWRKLYELTTRVKGWQPGQPLQDAFEKILLEEGRSPEEAAKIAYQMAFQVASTHASAATAGHPDPWNAALGILRSQFPHWFERDPIVEPILREIRDLRKAGQQIARRENAFKVAREAMTHGQQKRWEAAIKASKTGNYSEFVGVYKNLTPDQVEFINRYARANGQKIHSGLAVGVDMGDFKTHDDVEFINNYLRKELDKLVKERILENVPDITGMPLHQQIKLGQKTLAQFELGPIEFAIPLLGKGPLAEGIAEVFSKINRIGLVSRLEKSFRHAFATSTESKDFDRLFSTYKALGIHLANGEVENGVKRYKEAEKLAKSLGVSTEELLHDLSKAVETSTAGIPARSLRTIVSPLFDASSRGATKAKEALEKAMSPVTKEPGPGVTPVQLEEMASAAGSDVSSEAAQELRRAGIEAAQEAKEKAVGELEQLKTPESVASAFDTRISTVLKDEPVLRRPDLTVEGIPANARAPRGSNWTADLSNVVVSSDIESVEEATHLNNVVNQRIRDVNHVLKRGLQPTSREFPRKPRKGFAGLEEILIMNREEGVAGFDDALGILGLNKTVFDKLPQGLVDFVAQAESRVEVRKLLEDELRHLTDIKDQLKPYGKLFTYYDQAELMRASATERTFKINAILANAREEGRFRQVKGPDGLYRPKTELTRDEMNQISRLTEERKRITEMADKLDDAVSSYEHPLIPPQVLKKYRASRAVVSQLRENKSQVIEKLEDLTRLEKTRFEELDLARKRLENYRATMGKPLQPGRPLSRETTELQADTFQKLRENVKNLEDEVLDIRNRKRTATSSTEPVKVAHYVPEPGTRQSLVHELMKQKKEYEELAEAALGHSIPVSLDKELIWSSMTHEGYERMRDYMIKEGLVKAGWSPSRIKAAAINLIQKESLVIDPAKAGALLESKGINFSEAVSLDKIRAVYRKGRISKEEFGSVIRVLGLNDINKYHQEFLFPWTHTVSSKPENLLNNDVIRSSVARGVRTRQAITVREFYGNLKSSKIGMKREELFEPITREVVDPKTGAKSIETVGYTNKFKKGFENYREVPQEELAGYFFPPEVAKALSKWDEFKYNDEVINKFLKGYDTVQDAWKAWTLAIFPAYHSRNMVGNLWNNWLAGIANPKYYTWAGRIQRGEEVTFIDGLGKRWDTKAIQEEMRRLGVMDKGQFGSDIFREIDAKLRHGRFDQLGRENWLVTKGFKLGQGIENNARIAHFTAKLAEGYTPQEAALSVKKYLFDYSELTDFEKNVMKRLFPFYAWTRKNIPLQLEHLVTNPAKFSVVYKGRKAVEDDTQSPNEKFLPQWVIENYPTRIRFNKDKNTYEYFLANAWLPAMDLVKLLELHETAVGMMAPIPKELIQQMFNYDLYTKRKIESFSGETSRVHIGPAGFDAPARVVHGAKLVRLLNEVDKLSRPEKEFGAKIVELAMGNTYTYDPKKAKKGYQIEKKKTISELRQGLNRERKKRPRNQGEINRIRQLIRETRHE